MLTSIYIYIYIYIYILVYIVLNTCVMNENIYYIIIYSILFYIIFIYLCILFYFILFYFYFSPAYPTLLFVIDPSIIFNISVLMVCVFSTVSLIMRFPYMHWPCNLDFTLITTDVNYQEKPPQVLRAACKILIQHICTFLWIHTLTLSTFQERSPSATRTE